ncbi:MAG: hypothetical protein PHH36_13415 [Sideroxydans sp.]|nr:hypothetical protein [Sideroxydans sp.]
MRNVLLALVMSAASSSSFADWQEVVSESTSDYYVDLYGVEKGKPIQKVKILEDWHAAFEDVHSYVWTEEYDCVKRLVRISDAKGYSARMGKGLVVEEGGPSGWKPMSEYSGERYTRIIVKNVCGFSIK